MSEPLNQYEQLAQSIRTKATCESNGRRIPPPINESNLRLIESELDFDLPPLMRLLYTQIGDGNYGPGYGLLPLLSANTDEEAGFTFLQLYNDWHSPESIDDDWCWDDWLVPLCDWGCGIYGCVDASEENGSVYRFNWASVKPGDAPEDYLDQTHESLTTWFEDWLSGGSCW